MASQRNNCASTKGEFFSRKQRRSIGFEWILISKISGTTLADAWNILKLTEKKQTVRKSATHIASLFKGQCSDIGNLYMTDEGDFNVEEIVSMEFFWGDHNEQDVRQGPYNSNRD
jgi:hypothetical protein